MEFDTMTIPSKQWNIVAKYYLRLESQLYCSKRMEEFSEQLFQVSHESRRDHGLGLLELPIWQGGVVPNTRNTFKPTQVNGWMVHLVIRVTWVKIQCYATLINWCLSDSPVGWRMRQRVCSGGRYHWLV